MAPKNPQRKSREKLTVRQRKFIKGLLEGLSATEAAKQAGYSKEWAGQNTPKILESTKVVETLEACLEKAGLTNEVMARKLAEGADALKTEFFAKDGEVIDSRDVIAWDSRHRYLETALKIKGYLIKYQLTGKDGEDITVKVYLPDNGRETEGADGDQDQS